MALSLLCGGLGVASAADVTVHVDASLTPNTATEVYTTTGVNTLLDGKADKTALDTKANATDVAKNTENIATNQGNIKKLEDDKLSKDVASATYATNKALNDLENAVTNKVDESVVEAALNDKANTDLSNLTEAGKTAIKTTMADELEKKADKTYVDTAVAGAVATAGTNVDAKLADYAKTTDVYNKAEVDGKIADEENARNTAINTAITQERNDRTTAIDTAINGEVTNRNQAINTAIEREKTNRDAAISTAKAELQEKIDKNSQDIAKLDASGVKYDTAVKDKITLDGAGGTTITHLKDATLSDSSTDAVTGKQLNKTNENLAAEEKARTTKDAELEGKINTLDGNVTTAQGDINALQAKDIELESKIQKNADNIQINKDAIAATDKRTGGIARNLEGTQTTIEGKVTVNNNGDVGGVKGLSAETITTTGNADLKGNVILGTNAANMVTVNGKADFNEAVNMDNGLTVTNGDTKLKATTVDGKLTAGDAELKNTKVDGTLGVTGETKLDDKLTVKGEAKFEKNVTVDKDLTVNGKLKTDKISMENHELKTNGDKHDSTTTITADGISNDAKVTDKNGIRTESKFTHDKEGSTTYAKKGNATDWKESTSNVTADGVSNNMTDSAGNTHTYYQTATETKEQLVNGKKSNFEKKTAEGNTISIKDEDADGNKKSLTNTQTVDGEKTSVTNKDSSSTINQGADQIRHNVTSADGKKSSIEVKADGITNTSKDGTITNDAKDIVNNATGDMTNTVGGNLSTTVGGNEIHEVKGTKTETVEGKVTENFKNGQETNVTGNQDIHVTGKQTNTVEGGQVNNISDGQKNNILTGNQETTVTDGSIINKAENGDISNTAKNVTNEGTESVTNKVGTNEVKVSTDGVDIKVDAGKKITESVGTTSRVVENDKITDKAADSTVTTENGKGTTFGKEGSTGTTNIYGDSIKTGTINAKDTTTDKLTAGAAAGADGGRLTVDAKDGVKGSYKSGDYTSRSYILANTLKSGVDNGKDPTDADFVGSRTDHYMDGDKAKLDETVKDADGSNVTNKTSTGTVTTITDGNTTSIIDQKKDSITSAVGDGTTSTVIKQDKDNVTIASSAGTVGIAGKDIINNATDTITNTAGTKITDTAGDSTVTTENGKGTTFTKTGSTAYREGGPTDTNISGNTITTGKVTMDYAEVMKDLGVRGNANITGKTTTGSLEVKGESKLTGDVTMESNATVTKDLSVGGTTTTKTLNVTENATVGGTLDVTQKATFHDDVDITKNLSVGGNATITGDVTAKSYKVGDKTYISAAGINANDQKITNVADGSISEGSKDAVNGGQLYTVKNDFEGKVNKVGANAAAMANLHPMEFDPDSKWNIAAAIGNYGSETAAALGAFYRPNDDVMVNLSTAFGTGENMVGGGVSVRLGKGGNKLSREESNALKAQVDDLTARMDALLSVLNPNMSKDFPDVPENHWAYEAVSRLAGNDIVQGYPDGEFHGERTMTRYEMAEIIYNALSRGAEAEKELVEEFKPELQAMAASEKATAEKAEG